MRLLKYGNLSSEELFSLCYYQKAFLTLIMVSRIPFLLKQNIFTTLKLDIG